MAYIKFVGVRSSYRKRGVARSLYEYFIEKAREHGSRQLKAITTVKNTGSIAFHRKIGMQLSGEPNENGIPVVREYAGPGMDRVVFLKDI